MAGNPFGLFVIIAQMSVAFAGFGSLSTRLGQAGGGDDARVNATRLNLMLFTSLSTTMLGLLPATLGGIILDDRLAVRCCALLAIVALVIYAATGLRRAFGLRQALGFSRVGLMSNLVCISIALAGFLSSAVGCPGDRIEATYLLGLVGLLGSSIIMFARVIISMLGPHNRSSTPD